MSQMERYCEHNCELDTSGNVTCPECRIKLLEKELADLKAKPDCTGCVRAKGGKPADVYNNACFECSRPDWCNKDFYEAKRKGE